MTLENQVCSLDLAKRLKELGVKQESLFWWNQFAQDDLSYNLQAEKSDLCISAFTCAELGEMLPVEYWEKQGRTIVGTYGFWFGDEEAVYADTEADARGKMLIYLLENRLI